MVLPDDDGEWVRKRLEELCPELAMAIEDVQWTTGLPEDISLMAKFQNLLFELYVLNYQKHGPHLFEHVQLVGMTVSGCLKMFGEGSGYFKKLLQGRRCLIIGDELEDWSEAELICTCCNASAFLGIGDPGQVLKQIFSDQCPAILEDYKEELRSKEKIIGAFEYLPQEVITVTVLNETRRMGRLAVQGAEAAAPSGLVAHPSSPETSCAVLRFPEHHFTRFVTRLSKTR